MAFTTRKFGVEIEFTFNGYENEIGRLAQQISETSGFGCSYEGYTHARLARWKIVRDGSCGWELVSPPLTGAEGLQQVKKVVRALCQHGGRVNRQCGLHVHVDAHGLSVGDVRNVVTRYGAFENTIDSFMPISRRANNNSYCRSLGNLLNDVYVQDRYRNVSSVRDLANVISDRYYKINLQSYLRHGTIEFRQHSGTVNASKITNWIKFCVAFVEASRVNRSPVTGNVGAPRARRMNRSNKLRALALCLQTYSQSRSVVYNEYLMREVGLQENTLSSYLSILRNQFGWQIPRRNGAAYISNFVVGQIPGDIAPVAATATVVNQPIGADAWNRDIDADVIAYLEERALDLASA